MLERKRLDCALSYSLSIARNCHPEMTFKMKHTEIEDTSHNVFSDI